MRHSRAGLVPGLTVMPLSGVLVVQPTVPELPWSARQAQMSSTIVSLAFTTRLAVAFPAMSPPIRKNVSWTEIGRRRACRRGGGQTR